VRRERETQRERQNERIWRREGETVRREVETDRRKGETVRREGKGEKRVGEQREERKIVRVEGRETEGETE
jgi:hypothetical protein